MEIYLIRHTSVAIEKGICYGRTDVALADMFEQESDNVAKNLEGIVFDRIYASPLNRCRKLAEKLFPGKIIYDERLKEMSFGSWELQKWDDIKDPLFQEWMDDWENVRCRDGESLLDVNIRLQSFLEDIKPVDSERIALFVHGGIIKVTEAIFKNIPLNELFNTPPIDFGGILRIENIVWSKV